MNIKKIMPLFAIAMGLVLVVATSGFKTTQKDEPNRNKIITTWFKFVGKDPTDLAQVQDYLNYSYVDGQSCNGLTNKICAVQTQGIPQMGQSPSAPFSSALLDHIEDVVNDGATYPEITQRQ